MILKRRQNVAKKEQQNGRRGHSFGMVRDEDAEWESTEELAVVKVSIAS